MMYESNVIILVTQTVFGIEQLLGLMFGRMLPSNRFYIEVVCGLQDGVRYVGTLMMTITEAFTKAVGVDRISLNSLNDTVGFYEKLGYAPHTRKERYDGMVAMIKKMGGGRRKTRRAIRKSRRRRTIK